MPTPVPPRSVTIDPGGNPASRAYGNLIGKGLLRDLRARINDAMGGPRSTLVLADSALSPDIVQSVAGDTSGAQATVVTWQPSEAHKSPEQAITLLKTMAAAGLTRSSVVIALGGGVTGDMAGFVAAVYQRGIAWVNCPTTLLAMVDASIGGKTGVNLEVPGLSASLKNFVGAIHHPCMVVSDVETLRTLPERPFRAGLAECIKHTMIAADWGFPDLESWTRSRLSAIVKRHEESLIELIARNISLKATVVAADEREEGTGPGGGRMALNLGHTFAHAIETLPGAAIPGLPRPIEHGEAVGLGLIAAAATGAALGTVESSRAEATRNLIEACGLPTRVVGLPGDEELIRRMTRDKKARAGVLRMIVPCGPGRVRIADDPPIEAVRAGFAAIRG